MNIQKNPIKIVLISLIILKIKIAKVNIKVKQYFNQIIKMMMIMMIMKKNFNQKIIIIQK